MAQQESLPRIGSQSRVLLPAQHTLEGAIKRYPTIITTCEQLKVKMHRMEMPAQQ